MRWNFNIMTFEEKCTTGLSIINNKADAYTIFNIVKHLVKRYINDKDDIELLNNCIEYNVKIIDNKINSILFYFGKYWNRYFVSLDAFVFTIRQQEGHNPFSKKILDISTLDIEWDKI